MAYEDKLNRFEKWLNKNTALKKNSRKQYVLQIKKFFDLFSVESLDNFRQFLYLKRADRIVYHRRYAVKRYLEFIGKNEWIEKLNPVFKTLKLQERRYDRYIDFKHFREMLDYLMDKHKALTTALMVLWDTGMRISPIVNLKVRDIKKDQDGYYITAIEKGGKRSNRYLDAYTVEMLKKIIIGKGNDDYVFRNCINVTWESWWKCYYRMWKELKTTSRKFMNVGYGISFHWVRTSRAKELYKKYKDVLKVKGFLGHKKIDTTMRYIDEGEISSAEIIKEEKGKWG